MGRESLEEEKGRGINALDSRFPILFEMLGHFFGQLSTSRKHSGIPS